MGFGNFYNVGLASTDSSSPQDLTKIHGNGTLWGTGQGNVRPGDTFEQASVRVTIASVESDEELTLLYAWPGSSATDQPYVIRQDSPQRLTQVEAAQGVADLLAALKIREDSAPIYIIEAFGVNTPPTDYSVGEKLVVGSPSPTGAFGDHSNEVAEKTVNGWAFFPPEHGWITIDKSVTPNLARNWDAGAGEWQTTGSLLGAPIWEHAWDSATAYSPGNLVTYQGRVYIADADNTNSPPNSSPSAWTEWGTIGEHGGAPTMLYVFKTATAATTADTAGNINLDAAPGSATKLYLNKVDARGNDWSTTLASLANNTSARLGRVRLIVPGDQTRQWQAAVTAIVANGDRFELSLETGTPELGQAALVDGSDILFMWTDTGDEGAVGATGATGDRGAFGGGVALTYQFKSDVTETDTASGQCNLNNATQGSATALMIDAVDAGGNSRSNLIDSILTYGLGTDKAMARLVSAADPEGKYIGFTIQNVETVGTSRKLTIDVIEFSGTNPLTADEQVVLSWSPMVKGDTGDQGPQGDIGPPIRPDHIVNALTDRDAYNTAANGTSVLVLADSSNDNLPTLYFMQDNTSSPAIWTSGVNFVSPAASEDVFGAVKLATPEEVVAGTDTAKAATSEGVAAAVSARTESIIIAVTDEAVAVAAGAAKVTLRAPYALSLTDVRASLTTAQSAGSILTVDINKNGTTIISTKITIDNGAKSSVGATTPVAISDAEMADNDEITIDVDQIGNGTAAGLKIYLIGTRP